MSPLESIEGTASSPAKRLIGHLFVLILVLVGFGGSFRRGSLNYDDPLYLNGPAGAAAGLSLQSLGNSLTSTEANLWHPLTWVSFQVEGAIAAGKGWQMRLHHLTNLLLYLSTLVVIALGLTRLMIPVVAGCFFLAFFALHPLHVESVTWIAARKDVLSGLFQSLCLLAYLGERDSGRNRLSLLFFVLAILSKPSAIVTPALLLILGEALSKKEGRASCFASVHSLIKELLVLRWFWLVAFLAALITIWVQSQGTMAGVAQSSGLLERLLLIPARTGAYLVKILIPLNLTFEYPLPGSAVRLAFTLLGLVIFLIPVIDFLRPRSLSWLSLAILWMLVCLAPVLGLVFVSDSFINDRYTFWAMAGPLAWLTGFGARVFPPKVAFATGILMIILLLALTRRQVEVWSSNDRLFGQALALYPNHLTALGNMGTLERTRGNESLALDYYERALAVNPADHIVLYNKAQILARQGDRAAAVQACRACLEAYPNYPGALRLLQYLESQSGEPKGRR